jgi:hypothetical protein
MVDGPSEWDRLIRARHVEQRGKLGLPLILADLPVHLHRSLVSEYEDFCFCKSKRLLIHKAASRV